MANELEKRRKFIKRVTIATSVLAGSIAATALTSQKQDRGANSSVGNGVVVGRSNKKEILYNKTTTWDKFYQAAKQL